MKTYILMIAVLAIVLIMGLCDVFADEVRCYSYGRKVLDAKGESFEYHADEKVLSFYDRKHNETLYVFTPDCVVKLNNED